MASQDPVEVTCPSCQAKPGERCTQPTNTGRAIVRFIHAARYAAAREQEETG